jgi:hypothetical protein
MRPAPDFAIIGAMKAATSTLHDQLAAQPGFAMSDPKEPCFFSDDDVFARGFDWYEACFPKPADQRLRGESSTHYAKLPDLSEAAARLQARRPDARIVYVIRHPVDRLVSHFMHGWSEGWYGDSIEEAVAQDSSLVDYGRYAMQLRPWLERFGAERVLLVAYDGIRSRPQLVLDRVGRFLGAEEPLRWRDDLAPRNVSTERVKQGWFRRCLVDPVWATSLRRAIVPKSLRNTVRESLQMRQRPTLDEAVRRRLEQVFDKDLAELSTWIGRPIDCATFVEATVEAPLDWADAATRLFPDPHREVAR